MDLRIAKRHWFADEKTLQALEGSIEDLRAASQLGKDHGFSLSFLLSTDSKRLKHEDLKRAEDAVNKIEDLGIAVLYDKRGMTAGEKFAYQLFRDSGGLKDDTVLALCCLDQYPLYRGEHIEPAIELGQKMLRDKKWYANGSRNVPVALGVNKTPSDMRIVHELLHTLAAPEGIFEAEKPDWANPSSAYAHFGEITSGFYFVNPNHPLHKDHCQAVQTHKELITAPGFAIEYFTALHAGLQDSASTGYVHAAENIFYSSVDEQAETSKVRDFIRNQTRLVGHTYVGEKLREVAANENILRRLHDFFEPEVVGEVAAITLEGLSSC